MREREEARKEEKDDQLTNRSHMSVECRATKLRLFLELDTKFKSQKVGATPIDPSRGSK
jgi:hypothetical protein